MTVRLDFLKQIPYFYGIGPAELDSIGKFIFEGTAEKGEMILLEGESGEELYFVASGVVKVFGVSSAGKEQILDIVYPGGSFNDVPVFDSGPNPASAQAMGPVVLYRIKKSNVEAIQRDYPQVALNAIRVLASRVRRLISLVGDLSFRHVIGRLAKILLEHAGNGADRRRLTQQEMAAMTGTAREVIGRSLKSLEERGVIRLDRHRIVITDNKALKEMTEVRS
jgi:CRP-like cAMP-binding protein